MNTQPEPDNAMYRVGKNAIDNWKIYKESNQTDTIFHLDKFLVRPHHSYRLYKAAGIRGQEAVTH